MDNLTVQRIDSAAAVDALADEWRQCQDRSEHPSIFAGYDYIRLAWRYSRLPQDRLLLLVVRDGGRAVAFAPFRVSIEFRRGIPVRVVEWLARWEGDRPDMLCAGDPDACWRRIEHFFAAEYRQWDLLTLAERTTRLSPGGELARASWIETEPDSVGYDISLAGDFDGYLATIDARVRSNWRKRARKIAALGVDVERIAEPSAMAAAVDRFVALERDGWKGEDGIGIGKDERHRRFYAELTTALAQRGEAEFRFLRHGERDVAAALLFMLGDTVSIRQIAYHPDYASLSPGIVLRAELLKSLFGGRWKRVELLGMHPAAGAQRHKSDWATDRWDGVSQHCYRRWGRLTPILFARRFRAWWQSARNSAAQS